MKLEYEVLRAAIRGGEDKFYLFRIIEEMTELNRAANLNGLLSIDTVLWPGFDADCMVFELGLNLVTSGCDPELVKSVMHNMIFTAYESGNNLMRTILIAAGLVSLARRDPARAAAHLLATYMGDECVKEYDDFCNSDEYKEHLDIIHNVIYDDVRFNEQQS